MPQVLFFKLFIAEHQVGLVSSQTAHATYHVNVSIGHGSRKHRALLELRLSMSKCGKEAIMRLTGAAAHVPGLVPGKPRRSHMSIVRPSRLPVSDLIMAIL